MENMVEILIPLGFFGSVVFSLFWYLKLRNAERMAMIEKCESISEIYNKKSQKTFPWIRIAMLMIGVGIGVLVSVIIIATVDLSVAGIGDETVTFPCILIFGGLGMFLGNHITKRQKA